MADQPGVERVNAFRIGGVYYLRHYFDGEAVFDRLRQYYDTHHYRFEIPVDEFASVRRFLADRGYRLDPVTELDEYLVVVRQYTAHPDNVFKASVYTWEIEDYHCFLLKDGDAVTEAVADGATRLADVANETLTEYDYRDRSYAAIA